MKTFTITVATFGAILFFANFAWAPSDEIQPEAGFEIPENVNSIMKKSCFGCHNSDSRNTKGKAKLKIDQLTSLKKGKLIGKLSKIAKAIEKGDMPPEKFLAKYPEKALTDDEKSTLLNWAKSTAENLAK